MTVADMADYVCRKINQKAPEDVVACKLFLKNNYNTLWNDQLWKDSLVRVDMALAPTTNLDHKDGIIIVPDIIEKVVACRSTDRALKVMGVEYYFRVDLDVFAQEGTISEFSLMSPIWKTVRPAESLGAGSTITIETDTSDTSAVKVIWRDLAGKRYETTADLPTITLTPEDDAGYFEIESIYKSTTTDAVSVTLHKAGGGTTLLGTLTQDDTRSPSYQRIALYRKPSSAITIRILGKRKADTLDFDAQEPLIANIESCLMALAQVDMLERSRQYGKSKVVTDKAAILLEQLKGIEVVQQARHARMIPEDGYGAGWDLYAHPPLQF
jgi:hypothetical protein